MENLFYYLHPFVMFDNAHFVNLHLSNPTLSKAEAQSLANRVYAKDNMALTGSTGGLLTLPLKLK